VSPAAGGHQAAAVIRLATSDVDIDRCWPVMVQLLPALPRGSFVSTVRRMEREGYRLALLEDGGAVRAVAGYRVMEMLAYGRHMYVDNLVTDEASRSQGYGDAIFDWLMAEARRDGCRHLHLDSGTHRAAAHRFYFRRRMAIADYHFTLSLPAEDLP
jgi:GNAT superfamily N-acetyltransferase